MHNETNMIMGNDGLLGEIFCRTTQQSKARGVKQILRRHFFVEWILQSAVRQICLQEDT